MNSPDLTTPARFLNATRCIVAGCTNHRHEGQFPGELCAPCHHMITTGERDHSNSFIGKLHEEIKALREQVATLQPSRKFTPGPPMTEADLRHLKPGDTVRHRRLGQSFQVTENYGSRVTAVGTADVTNPEEWEVTNRVVHFRELDSLLNPSKYLP